MSVMRRARVVTLVAGIGALLTAWNVSSDAWVRMALDASTYGVLPPSTIAAVRQLPWPAGLSGVALVIYAATAPGWWRIGVAIVQFVAYGSSRHVVIAIGCAAIALRLFYALIVDNAPVYDWADYDALARGLISGAGYAENGQLSAYRPPGYPFFLAFVYSVVGARPVWGEIANACLGTIGCLLIYLLAREQFTERVGRVAGLMTAVSPTQIFFAGLLASEALFTTLLLAALVLLGRTLQPSTVPSTLARSTAIGVLIGVSALVRPVTLLFPLVVALWAAFAWRRGAVAANRVVMVPAAVSLGMILTLAPWIARNYLRFHQIIPVSTSGAENFWIGAHPGADGTINSRVPYDTVVARHGGDAGAGYTEGVRFIAEQPLAYARLAVLKTRQLLLIGAYGVGWEIDGAIDEPMPELLQLVLARIAAVFYWSMLAAALLSVWFRPRYPVIDLLLVIVAYWIVFHALFFGQPRFRFPLEPLLAVLAAVTIVELSGRWRTATT